MTEPTDEEVERVRMAMVLEMARIERGTFVHDLTDDEERALARAAISAMQSEGVKR